MSIDDLAEGLPCKTCLMRPLCVRKTITRLYTECDIFSSFVDNKVANMDGCEGLPPIARLSIWRNEVYGTGSM